MKLIILIFFAFSFAKSHSLETLKTRDDDNVAIVQDLFNGFWAFANLTEPKGLAQKCFDEPTAKLLVDTANQTMYYLVQNNFFKAVQVASTLYHKVPPETNQCMNDSPYTQEMYDAYGLKNYTVVQMSGKFATYMLTHIDECKKDVVVANNHFQAADYFSVGEDGGRFTWKVFHGEKEIGSILI